MTNKKNCDIISKRSKKTCKNGGIAQLARATGSYPVGHGFKSNSRYQRPVGQAAKTPPFHGGNGSSILPRVTKRNKSELFRKSKLVRICFLLFIKELGNKCPISHNEKYKSIRIGENDSVYCCGRVIGIVEE